MASNLLYRVMLRLDDNSLVSPHALLALRKTSINKDGEHLTIDYGFVFTSLECTRKFVSSYSVYKSRLEIWSVTVGSYKNIVRELHPYQLFCASQENLSKIIQCFWEDDYSDSPVKIGNVLAPDRTIFCKDIKLIELVEKNYG